MPKFKITQRETTTNITADFNSVWGIVDQTNVSHDSHGVYSYIGGGGSSEKDIGSIRTLLPLDPNMGEGMSSFETTILDTGIYSIRALIITCNETTVNKPYHIQCTIKQLPINLCPKEDYYSVC